MGWRGDATPLCRSCLLRALGGGLEEFTKLGKSSGVHDILGSEPAFTGESDAEIQKAEMGCFMGIGVDTAKNAKIAGFVPPAPIEVEAPRVGIQLDPSTCGGGGI